MISASTANSKTGLPNMDGGSRSEFEPSKGSPRRPGSSSGRSRGVNSGGVTDSPMDVCFGANRGPSSPIRDEQKSGSSDNPLGGDQQGGRDREAKRISCLIVDNEIDLCW